mgnify:FL=1
MRPSASVLDVLAIGRAVVALEGAAIRAQLTAPATVGVLAAGIGDLSRAVVEAFDLTRRHPERFETYRSYRSPARIGQLLAGQLQGSPVKGTST